MPARARPGPGHVVMRRCTHVHADGRECGVPESFVDADTGYCRSHGPGAAERMAAQGRKGAEATAKKLRGVGLDPNELPSLRTHEDAQAWLETIGRAVATGRLSDRQAQAAIRAVSEWVRAEAERVTGVVVNELRSELDRVKAEIASSSIRAV